MDFRLMLQKGTRFLGKLVKFRSRDNGRIFSPIFEESGATSTQIERNPITIETSSFLLVPSEFLSPITNQ